MLTMHLKKFFFCNSQAMVCWSLLLPTSKPNLCTDNPRSTTKLCLGKPKSAHGKSGHLVFGRIDGQSFSLFSDCFNVTVHL